jgi:hypothetical protein
VQLCIACGGEIINDGIRDGVKAVENGVGWCDSPDGKIVVREVNCVGDAEGL